MKKSALGKGLDAIFAENTNENGAVSIKIRDIEPNKTQPRKRFDDAALNELADSIAQHGIIQPILVRPIFTGGYQIVAGERRWRAARMAGLSEIPALVKEMDDMVFMQLALIENLQREDLSPMEEAKGFESLIEEHDMSQDELSKVIGKSRPAITNALRLLRLPKEVQEMLDNEELSAGHARALLSLKEEDKILLIAKQTVQNGYSVRELEAICKKLQNEEPKKREAKPKLHFYSEVQLALNEFLGRKVNVSGGKKKGVLEIEFYGEDDLKQLIDSLNLKQ